MKEFEFTETVYFSEDDEKEVLERVANGMTVERAVADWICELDDHVYYMFCRVENQIINYVYSLLEREEK